MSLIIPKKEILYAPMLGTLGGGSARGFGRYAGGAGGPRLFVHSFQNFGDSYAGGEVSTTAFTSTTTANALQKTTTPTVGGNFPSTVADTYVHTDGKILQVTYKDSYIYLYDSDDIASGPISNDFIGSDCRCLVTASNNSIYVFLNNGTNSVYEYTVNNSYQLYRQSSFNRPRSNTVECAVSPPNDNYLYYGDHDGYIYMVDISGGNFPNSSSYYKGITFKSLSFHHDGRLLFGGNAGEIGRINVTTGGVWNNESSRTHVWGGGGYTGSIEVDQASNVHWWRQGGYLEVTTSGLSTAGNKDYSSLVGAPAGIKAIGDYVYMGTNGVVYDSVFRYPYANFSTHETMNNARLGYCNELTTDVRTDDNTARNLENAGLAFRP